MSDHSDTEDQQPLGLFAEEPQDFYPPSPPPTTQSHTTSSGQSITLHLVGHSPLEAHHLWNGARVVSDFFESSPSTTVKDRTVLELGAGAGLPSIMAAILGAKKVVVTDFPDPDLVANMWKNIRGCEHIPHAGEPDDQLPIAADGFVWGADPTHLLAHLPPAEKGFDVLILADLLFRHSEHKNMIKTITETLAKKKDAKAYVVFCSYRPWLQHKDLVFFDLAREAGFTVEKVLEKKMERPLFENDPGDEEVLKTVTGWVVGWPEEVCVDL
ncbi:protein N-methyltransferase nnt1 [Podospora australis]|uniref:Protein N-terminal and lysine N-methyltransferase EFM7 n=1 Tax=Podospora australis TaxID=1536484 RepID=A0AAN6WYJ5_9PEZI|nr:protein N-methyltransferase nnt1 [Podospora australis]